SLTVSATWLTDKPRTIGPEVRAPSCARVGVGNTSAANAWTRCRRVIRPRSYWSNNESTMEFISGTSRCNHRSFERGFPTLAGSRNDGDEHHEGHHAGQPDTIYRCAASRKKYGRPRQSHVEAHDRSGK